MSSPLASVIMSVYNCEKYIKESLQSVFNQTFKDFEIIIYDDASTDNTQQIVADFLNEDVQKYAEIPVRIIYGKENVGCGEGRNRAIKMSKNIYIAIQDGDDVSRNDRLEKEVEKLEGGDIFCVGSSALVIDQNNHWVKYMDYPPLKHENIVKMLFGFVNPMIDPSCMFRRDIFNKLGGYINKWELIPDFYLWARAIVAGYKFANVPETLIYYRKHSRGVMELYHKEAIREHMDMCRRYISRKRPR